LTDIQETHEHCVMTVNPLNLVAAKHGRGRK